MSASEDGVRGAGRVSTSASDERDGIDRACDRCLARSWLLGRLAGILETVRGQIGQVLALDDDQLLAAVAGDRAERLRGELERFDPTHAHERSAAAGLELICRCDPDYPAGLRALAGPPAVLHVAGGLGRFLTLLTEGPVAIVGARRASTSGLEIARSLGRGLGSAGVPVVSGMALGIDSAAHAGALDAVAPTIAVLPGGADHAYPRCKRGLHGRIREAGAVVSELPPGMEIRRWTFVARNRVIAALAAMTIVVEAGERSGALVTAGFAASLGRPVGAVPGRITSPLASGPNALLAGGARVVRGPGDVLDHLFGEGVRRSSASADRTQQLAPELQALLAAIADGHDTAAALERAGFPADEGLAALASLELAGYVRRGAGGRFAVSP
jgi:DNA processing protein